MSKKRKREVDTTTVAGKPVTALGPSEELVSEKSKKDKSHRKGKKERPGSDLKGKLEPSHTSEVDFASLAKVSDIDSAGEETVEVNASKLVDLDDTDETNETNSMDVDEPASSKSEKVKDNELDMKKSKKNPIDNDFSTGHLSILSKFDKYRADILSSATKTGTIETATTKEEPLQGLHPLPQRPQAPVQKVDPNSVLPSYLSQPTTVPTTQRPPFKSFNLPDHLLEHLQKLDLVDTFPVQAALLSLLLPISQKPSVTAKSDLLVSAATGSGKTLSYLLPILSSLLNRTVPRTYALIIVPTHELATQVQRTAHSLASGTSLKISTAIGVRPFEVEKDYIIANDIGSTGSDILVATPGRLVEHIRNNPRFTLKYLQWLIIDEADRLLSQSFQDWVQVVGDELQKPFETNIKSSGTECFDIASLGLRAPKCPADNLRKVILSATMTRDVGKLAGLKLKRPQLIAVDDMSSREVLMGDREDMTRDGDNETMELKELSSLPSTLEEHYYPISKSSQKPLILSRLLSKGSITSGILVFTKSNESAARLARLLELLFVRTSGKKNSKTNSGKKKWTIAVSTSDKRKRDISANTSKFKSSAIDILISTDLMARGVDLPNAQLVINYDSPRNLRDYIHRVGRTARAGNMGVAWSLVEDSEARWWWAGIGKVRRGRAEGVAKHSMPAMKEEDMQLYEIALDKLEKEVRES
ncbi:hypothetical protein ABW20_dc0106144 [Dactylellina cionopaga]|nr:hypothetical protein ABW20_dc0106144 [Dactylellina cionopaga]